jgi:hypothetical protein
MPDSFHLRAGRSKDDDKDANPIMRVWFKLRRLIATSWVLSRCCHPRRGARLRGRPNDEIWYFAYGAKMHDGAFRAPRGIQPLECCGHIKGYGLEQTLTRKTIDHRSADVSV